MEDSANAMFVILLVFLIMIMAAFVTVAPSTGHRKKDDQDKDVQRVLVKARKKGFSQVEFEFTKK